MGSWGYLKKTQHDSLIVGFMDLINHEPSPRQLLQRVVDSILIAIQFFFASNEYAKHKIVIRSKASNVRYIRLDINNLGKEHMLHNTERR